MGEHRKSAPSMCQQRASCTYAATVNAEGVQQGDGDRRGRVVVVGGGDRVAWAEFVCHGLIRTRASRMAMADPLFHVSPILCTLQRMAILHKAGVVNWI